MKNAWEAIVEGNQTKYVYKSKEEREWERFDQAYKVIESHFNLSFYKRQSKPRQGVMRTMAARLTKLMGLFWGREGLHTDM